MEDKTYVVQKFDFYFYKNKIISKQTFNFDEMDTIKVEIITINVVSYMTY